MNIAARLEALSQPNGISISKPVHDFVNGKTELVFNDLGVQQVKENKFQVFDVLLDPSHKRRIPKKFAVPKTPDDSRVGCDVDRHRGNLVWLAKHK